jgi:hypothetical protein
MYPQYIPSKHLPLLLLSSHRLRPGPLILETDRQRCHQTWLGNTPTKWASIYGKNWENPRTKWWIFQQTMFDKTFCNHNHWASYSLDSILNTNMILADHPQNHPKAHQFFSTFIGIRWWGDYPQLAVVIYEPQITLWWAIDRIAKVKFSELAMEHGPVRR